MNMTNLLLTIVMAAVAVAAGCSTTTGVAKVNTDARGFAVRGYDAVAFFADNGAIEGNPSFEYAWNGAKWLFANAENLDRFRQNPEAFAPQFGGYCSYAVSHGYTADGDPQTFKIVDGKLYLNYNQKAKEAWEAEQERFIEDGKRNWNEFQKAKPQHKG